MSDAADFKDGPLSEAAHGAMPRYTPSLPAPRRGWDGWAGPHGRAQGPATPAPGLPAQPRARQPGRARRAVRSALLAARDLFIVLLLFLLLRAAVEGFSVDGFSMQPTLHDNDRVLVNKISYRRVDLGFLDWVPIFGDELSEERFLIHGPRRGDIVVFDDPRFQGEEIVKRIIGLPGETVEIRDGTVFIDGRRLEEPYLDVEWFENRPPVVVDEGHYFVLGDNRTASVDSRSLGPVPLSAIVGKLSAVYWPPERFTLGPNLPLGEETPSLTQAGASARPASAR